jgi:hypothetical protein
MSRSLKTISIALLFCGLAAIMSVHSTADDSGLKFPGSFDVERYRSVALPGDAPTGEEKVSVEGPVLHELSQATSPSANLPSKDGPGYVVASDREARKEKTPVQLPPILPRTDRPVPVVVATDASATARSAIAEPREPARLPIFLAEKEPVKSEGAAVKPSRPANAAAKPSGKAEKRLDKKSEEPARLDAAATAGPALPELSAEMAALRDRVRLALATYYQQSLNTRDNTVSDILQVCLAYGCQSEVLYGSEKLNGVTCLCWDYPCGDYQPLMVINGHVAARVGYGVQNEPSQLLAVLAMSRVPVDYPARVGNKVRTVADLVASEKLNCRAGIGQPFRLIGLSYYVPGKQSWTNDRGEPWNLERLIRDELAQPDAESSVAGTDRLLGLSFAVAKLVKVRAPLGDLGRAKKFIEDYQQFAFRVQNSDGSWHPLFFAALGTSGDWQATLYATSHILEWLAISLPVDQLEKPELVRTVEYVTTRLTNQSTQWNAAALSGKNLDAVMHALHALSVYDERAFKPHDPKKVEGEEKKAAGDSEKPAAVAKEAGKQ